MKRFKSIICILLAMLMLSIVVMASTTTTAGFSANNVQVYSGYSSPGPDRAQVRAVADTSGNVTYRLWSLEMNGESGVRISNTISRVGEIRGDFYTNTVSTRAFRASAQSSKTSGFVYCYYE